MRVLRWLGWSVVGLVAVGCVLAVAARFTDGPIGYFRGGSLSGVAATAPVDDWSRLVERGSAIELETRPEDPYSVTIEARIRDGRLYSWSAWEHGWNTNVLADPRAVVRIAGTLHEVTAVPVSDANELALLHGVAAEVAGEVGGVAFRFDPRSD